MEYGNAGTFTHATVHLEDSRATPGRQEFVLRDDQGGEIARTIDFAPSEVAARERFDWLMDLLTGLGWQVSQSLNAAFSDPWWAYRFTVPASPQARLGLMQAKALDGRLSPTPFAPRARMRRAQRRYLKIAGMLILLCVVANIVIWFAWLVFMRLFLPH
ncbi:MAG TPA: hypothetical protein VNP95_00810 [Thermomicrobiales bacterium]|nr:hypothetical protein [Thermomicrobiales bacterium]